MSKSDPIEVGITQDQFYTALLVLEVFRDDVTNPGQDKIINDAHALLQEYKQVVEFQPDY